MAQIIKIKRSTSAAQPGSALNAGELAYSYNSDKLFIGDGSNNLIIGGELYTGLFPSDIDGGTLEAGKILVAGKNFGCGSSREHAVWAIYDKGFRVVVSSFFADIFKNNCLNIGVLPIQVTDSFLLEIFSRIEKDPDSVFEVNLENQEFIIAESGKKEKFKISVYKKSNMSNGFDDIDYLLNKKKEISKFANKSRY